MIECYLNSWSSIQHYIKKNEENPVGAVIEKLSEFWKGEERVEFPLFTKVGII
jgi:hypothetical protein